MQLTKEDLIQRLKDSIPVMQAVLASVYSNYTRLNDKYLCHILDGTVDSSFCGYACSREIEGLVCNRMGMYSTFSNYLAEKDEHYHNLRSASGEFYTGVLSYEMQKKIQWVKDWIKELEDGTTDLKGGK